MHIITLDSCKSTNSTARDILDNNINSVPDTTVVARKQTQGRGRSGTWFSPEDCGIYMSVIRSNIQESGVVGLITHKLDYLLSEYFLLRIGVRHSRTCNTDGVNDIVLGGRKLAGIIVEYHTASGKLIVGVGLNTFRPGKIRKDLQDKAVWLNDYAAEHLIDHTKLINMIAEEIMKI